MRKKDELKKNVEREGLALKEVDKMGKEIECERDRTDVDLDVFLPNFLTFRLLVSELPKPHHTRKKLERET